MQKRSLPNLIGYFVTEIWTQNQVVHPSGDDSLAGREQRRAAMGADRDWVAYLQKSTAAGNVQHQENRILKSVSFLPL